MKYCFNVAMNIRAYGRAEIEADSPEAAKALLTAEHVRDTFEPHGGGDDDLAYDHPSQISCDGYCVDADGVEAEFDDFEVAEGDWVR